MAHDPAPGHSAVATATVEAVRAALADYINAPLANDELRPAICALAAEARERAILPEHVIVTLKDVWYSLPAVQSMTEPAEQTRLLQRIVTMCIKEYYTSRET